MNDKSACLVFARQALFASNEAGYTELARGLVLYYRKFCCEFCIGGFRENAKLQQNCSKILQ
jgi:hypothetical protein